MSRRGRRRTSYRYHGDGLPDDGSSGSLSYYDDGDVEMQPMRSRSDRRPDRRRRPAHRRERRGACDDAVDECLNGEWWRCGPCAKPEERVRRSRSRQRSDEDDAPLGPAGQDNTSLGPRGRGGCCGGAGCLQRCRRARGRGCLYDCFLSFHRDRETTARLFNTLRFKQRSIEALWEEAYPRTVLARTRAVFALALILWAASMYEDLFVDDASVVVFKIVIRSVGALWIAAMLYISTRLERTYRRHFFRFNMATLCVLWLCLDWIRLADTTQIAGVTLAGIQHVFLIYLTLAFLGVKAKNGALLSCALIVTAVVSANLIAFDLEKSFVHAVTLFGAASAGVVAAYREEFNAKKRFLLCRTLQMPLSTFVKQQNTEFDPHMALYLRHFRLQRVSLKFVDSEVEEAFLADHGKTWAFHLQVLCCTVLFFQTALGLQDLLLLRRGASLLPVRLVGIASPAVIFIVVVTVVRLSYRPLFISSLLVWLLTTGVYAYFLFIINHDGPSSQTDANVPGPIVDAYLGATVRVILMVLTASGILQGLAVAFALTAVLGFVVVTVVVHGNGGGVAFDVPLTSVYLALALVVGVSVVRIRERVARHIYALSKFALFLVESEAEGDGGDADGSADSVNSGAGVGSS